MNNLSRNLKNPLLGRNFPDSLQIFWMVRWWKCHEKNTYCCDLVDIKLQFYVLFVAKMICTLFCCEKIYALRPKSFCALKLPFGKIRLFGPLGRIWKGGGNDDPLKVEI